MGEIMWKHIFSHPDYTVGIGISPIRPRRLADFTAGRELHPALKTLHSIVWGYYNTLC